MPDELAGAGASRNLAYWDGAGGARVFNVRGRFLHAIDARTGNVVEGFGHRGRVNLLAGLGDKATSFRWAAPGPLVVGDVVVIGGQGWTDSGTQVDLPPGDVRGYDVRTGALRWTFHVVPRQGEPGIETWERDSWKDTGSAKAWSLMSADDELGYVYVPLSSAANEWYGGQRPGANLYSDSLVVPRRPHRRAQVALPDGAPRPVGLRQPHGAGARRPHRERPPHQGGDPGDQAGVRVRLRSRHR